jgi:glycosyltransferase involved in cell wall biosynthesis
MEILQTEARVSTITQEHICQPASNTNNPRIAIFASTSGHSGVDRAMQHLIPALARRGYAVDLLKVRRHGPNLSEIPENVRVIDLGSAHTYTCLPALVRYLRRERPAAMLADKDRVNRTALLARAIAQVPTRLILSSGTTISIDLAHRGAFERWLQRMSMGHLYPFADKVIVTSHGVADDMTAYTGLAREHIEVVPSPVIPDALLHTAQPRPDHPWFHDGGPPIVLSVGELGSRKGYDTLLRAFALLHHERPCRLLILGRGKQLAQLEQLAAELGIAEAVDFAGFQPNPFAFMAHADLFAFASRWEGLGFVLIEALAMGTPVVSTDCPSGPREILADGRYGELVPVGDHQAMARAMQKSLDAPADPAHLRQAALPYTIENSTSCYLRALGFPLPADNSE